MPSVITFLAAMTAVCASINDAGFKTDLWVPEFGWHQDEKRRDEDDEASASDKPFDLQLLAAKEIFKWMYCNSLAAEDRRVWVHLAAEMQAGKTGVINALVRLVLSNRGLGITPSHIFTLTGMSDDDWQVQTMRRLPRVLRENVHHSGTLGMVAARLESLAQTSPDGYLRNVLIILDESHHASSSGNRPNALIYKAVERLCPRAHWAENGIRFLTVSATDPAKVLAMQGSNVPTAVVRLQTDEKYQSVESLLVSGRLIYAEHPLHSAEGADILCAKMRTLEAVHGPLYHILRPNMARNKDMNADVEAMLTERMPGCRVIPWDLESKKRRAKEARDNNTEVSTDINDHLAEKPAQTTFILLKGMFRAAKTLKDIHIGVLYDRVGSGADSTNLQSLLGRACGYGKSPHTVIFASKSTVSNYLRLWRDLCANPRFPPEVVGVPKNALRNMMPGVDSKTSNGVTVVGLKPTAACPLSAGDAINVVLVPHRPRAPPPDENAFDVAWSVEFRTEAEAHDAAGGRAMKRNDAGFFRNRMGGKGPMTREQLARVKAGPKLAHSRIHLRPNQPVDHTTFAFYEDPLDSTTVRFVVRTLTRRADRQDGTIPTA